MSSVDSDVLLLLQNEAVAGPANYEKRSAWRLARVI